jgi:hypothetical protein
MNSLSWMIYAISAVTSFRTSIHGIGVLLIFGSIGLSIVTAIAMGVYDSSSWNTKPDENRFYPNIKKIWVKWMKIGVPLFFAIEFLLAVIPDRSTMLLIASSEIGQRLLSEKDITSGVVDPSIDLLKTWIATELEHQKGELVKEKDEVQKKVKDEVERRLKKIGE